MSYIKHGFTMLRVLSKYTNSAGGGLRVEWKKRPGSSRMLDGFTLVELLVVVSIIAILAIVVYESLDPLKQFANARNARRWSHVNSISTAIFRYVIEKGSYPEGIDEHKRQFGTSKNGCDQNCENTQQSCLDIGAKIIDYLPIMPIDLNGGTEAKTGYTISKNPANNVITVSACGAENGAQIFVMR